MIATFIDIGLVRVLYVLTLVVLRDAIKRTIDPHIFQCSSLCQVLAPRIYSDWCGWTIIPRLYLNTTAIWCQCCTKGARRRLKIPWNGDIILTKFSLLVALEVVKMIASSAASGGNLIKMAVRFEVVLLLSLPLQSPVVALILTHVWITLVRWNR